MKQRIEKVLNENLQIEHLSIIDNSSLHVGHRENKGNQETHFAIEIKSKDLQILSKINAHRKINQLLKEEFINGLHAIEIKVL